MKVKLYTALKIKNRLASDVARLAAILKRENCWEVGKESNYKLSNLWSEYQKTVEKLIRVKTAIAAANIGVYEHLERLAELKSQISLYQELETKQGVFKETVGSWGDKTSVEKKYDSYLSRENVDAMVHDFQKKVNETQDKVDEYNATTDVELPD